MLGDEPARLHLEEDKQKKIHVFGLWLATLPGKTGAPCFIRFSHILRDLSQILFPSKLLTNFKLGGEILPYFLLEANSATFWLMKCPSFT